MGGALNRLCDGVDVQTKTSLNTITRSLDTLPECTIAEQQTESLEDIPGLCDVACVNQLKSNPDPSLQHIVHTAKNMCNPVALNPNDTRMLRHSAPLRVAASALSQQRPNKQGSLLCSAIGRPEMLPTPPKYCTQTGMLQPSLNVLTS